MALSMPAGGPGMPEDAGIPEGGGIEEGEARAGFSQSGQDIDDKPVEGSDAPSEGRGPAPSFDQDAGSSS